MIFNTQKEDVDIQTMLEDGELLLLEADLSMADTPKKLYDKWQKVCKKGSDNRLDVNIYWNLLIDGTSVDLKHRLKKISSVEKRMQFVEDWKKKFEVYEFLFSNDTNQRLKKTAEELQNSARTYEAVSAD